MDKKVIIINGTGGSGKDTFVENVMKISTVNIDNISTVDKVKEVAIMLGWGGDKEERSRKFLSDIKDLWSEYCDGPYYNVLERIEKTNSEIIFVHCREPEEIGKFAKYYGEQCTTLLIKRTDHQTRGNHADENVENYSYDTVIDNDSDLMALQRKAIAFYKTECKTHPS